jgi:sigma-E factor negative regulatory protein RseC
MTQNAVVTNILSDGLAEVTVRRDSACGHNCSSCGGGCASIADVQKTIRITAKNLIGACIGDSVIIESKTAEVLSLAALVYLFPLVLLLIGFALCSVLKLSEGLSVGISILAFVTGCLITVFINKRLRKDRQLSVAIVSLNTQCSDS